MIAHRDRPLPDGRGSVSAYGDVAAFLSRDRQGAVLALILAAFPFTLSAQPETYTFENAQQFLKQYCQACHQGSSPAGGFDTQRLSSAASIQSEAERWNKVALRVKNGEMPPKIAPAPPVDQREQFTQWATASVRAVAC